jgi:hypothetical protein
VHRGPAGSRRLTNRPHPAGAATATRRSECQASRPGVRDANETADRRPGSVGDAKRIVSSTVVIVGAGIVGRLVMSGGLPIVD